MCLHVAVPPLCPGAVITSPVAIFSPHAVQYVSPVYPSVVHVSLTAPLTSVPSWFAGFNSPYSSPQTVHTALCLHVAVPPLCPSECITSPFWILTPHPIQYVSPVYPSVVHVTSTASLTSVPPTWLFGSTS